MGKANQVSDIHKLNLTSFEGKHFDLPDSLIEFLEEIYRDEIPAQDSISASSKSSGISTGFNQLSLHQVYTYLIRYLRENDLQNVLGPKNLKFDDRLKKALQTDQDNGDVFDLVGLISDLK